MTRICEFPNDDNLWFIKWIDEFKLLHRSTRSPSVSVLLQKLPFSDKSLINNITSRDIDSYFRRPVSDDQSRDLFLHNSHSWVLAGSLPLMTIGAIYQRTELVGHIPTSPLSLSLPDVEDSCNEVSLNDIIQSPEGWRKDLPYRVLNRFEYFGPRNRYPKSRCLLFQQGDIDVVIPRTVIFRRFYAPSTKLAQTFTTGPWSKVKKNVIFLGEMESGLKTQIADNGEWHLVLERDIDNCYGRHLAILHFDPYARVCAESVYSNSLIDRRGDRDLPWYSNAKIPFRTTDSPLEMTVRGYWLPRLRVKGINYRRKFLVTKIHGCSIPEYIPPMKFGRFNSGEIGKEVEEVDKPRPYSSRPKGRKKPNKNTSVDNNNDSHKESSSTDLVMDDETWLTSPPVGKLEKQSSKKYVGTSPPKPPVKDGDNVSTGEAGYGQNNLPQGKANILFRAPDRRFQFLLEAFRLLKGNGSIHSYSIFQPSTALQLIVRGGVSCWNLLDEKARNSGCWPRRSWRLVSPAEPTEAGYINGTPRCALVVKVSIENINGYWIEIECKKSEGGFLSPFLLGVDRNPNEVVEHCLEIIARKKGSGLRDALNTGIEELGYGRVICYKHAYENRKSSKLNLDSLCRFFQNSGISSSQENSL